MRIATAHVEGDLIHVTLSDTTIPGSSDSKTVRAKIVEIRLMLRELGFFDVYSFKNVGNELVLFIHGEEPS